MVRIYKKIFFGAALFIAGMEASSAQNLNPTVSVTRAYEGKLMEVHKPALPMNVPDSLTKFNLDFDYSVFDNPYKGSYDFKPYSMQMKPQAEPYSGRTLYLKAGAGWQLRPSLDVVWEPLMKKKFRMAVYGSHHSYIGKYKNELLNPDNELRTGDVTWNGYDMRSQVGFNGRSDFDKAVMAFDVNYLGLHTKDSLYSMGWNSVNASVRVRSENPAPSHFFYDIALKGMYAVQGMDSYMYDGVASDDLTMSNIDLAATFGRVSNPGSGFLVDFGVGVSSYSSLFSESDGVFSATPKYVFKRGSWNLSVGVKAALKFSSKDSFNGVELHSRKGQIVYPDVHISVSPVKDYLNIFVVATGGLDRNTYASLKERNHFYNPYFGRGVAPMAANTVERYNVSAGLRGNAVGKFFYDVRFGYASYEDAPMDALHFIGTDYFPALAYAKYDIFYSDVVLQWKSKSFDFDSKFRFNSADIKEANMMCFEPAFFVGDVKAIYNYKRRIFAGLTADFSSRRDGERKEIHDDVLRVWKASVPYWVNLGVEAEYVLTSKLSVWLRGDNLLNMNVQRTPMYYSGGIGFTAGICLNL